MKLLTACSLWFARPVFRQHPGTHHRDSTICSELGPPTSITKQENITQSSLVGTDSISVAVLTSRISLVWKTSQHTDHCGLGLSTYLCRQYILIPIISISWYHGSLSVLFSSHFLKTLVKTSRLEQMIPIGNTGF